MNLFELRIAILYLLDGYQKKIGESAFLKKNYLFLSSFALLLIWCCDCYSLLITLCPLTLLTCFVHRRQTRIGSKRYTLVRRSSLVLVILQA